MEANKSYIDQSVRSVIWLFVHCHAVEWNFNAVGIFRLAGSKTLRDVLWDEVSVIFVVVLYTDADVRIFKCELIIEAKG